jgi:hypothetical protein
MSGFFLLLGSLLTVGEKGDRELLWPPGDEGAAEETLQSFSNHSISS